jgi:hypothetical protein
MFKGAEQMEVAWSKVGSIRRMLEDFPLEILIVSFFLLAVWGRALSCKSNRVYCAEYLAVVHKVQSSKFYCSYDNRI